MRELFDEESFEASLEFDDFEVPNEYEDEQFDTELEEEVNRRSRTYIQWVQRSLNQILGTRLVVDGLLGPRTSSAVRSFQRQAGIKVDGRVGPQTERALISVGANLPPVTAGVNLSPVTTAGLPLTAAASLSPVTVTSVPPGYLTRAAMNRVTLRTVMFNMGRAYRQRKRFRTGCLGTAVNALLATLGFPMTRGATWRHWAKWTKVYSIAGWGGVTRRMFSPGRHLDRIVYHRASTSPTGKRGFFLMRWSQRSRKCRFVRKTVYRKTRDQKVKHHEPIEVKNLDIIYTAEGICNGRWCQRHALIAVLREWQDARGVWHGSVRYSSTTNPYGADTKLSCYYRACTSSHDQVVIDVRRFPARDDRRDPTIYKEKSRL